MAIWGQRGKEVDTISDVIKARFALPEAAARTRYTRALTEDVPRKRALENLKFLTKDERTTLRKNYDDAAAAGYTGSFEDWAVETEELKPRVPFKAGGRTFQIGETKAAELTASRERALLGLENAATKGGTLSELGKANSMILLKYGDVADIIMGPGGEQTLSVFGAQNAYDRMKEAALGAPEVRDEKGVLEIPAVPPDRKAQEDLAWYDMNEALAKGKYKHVAVEQLGKEFAEKVNELIPQMEAAGMTVTNIKNDAGTVLTLKLVNGKLFIIKMEK